MNPEENQPAIYGLKYAARSLRAQLGEKEKDRFLIGSQSLGDENEVHLIEYQEDANEITCERTYSHPPEIWDISPCPSRSEWFFTISNCVESFKAVLHCMPDLEQLSTNEVSLDYETQPLEEVLTLQGHIGVIKSVLWHPGGELNQVVSLDEQNIRVWDVEFGDQIAKQRNTGSDLRSQATGRWDPHRPNTVATASDTAVWLWDLRSMKRTQGIPHAHAVCVRDMDFNPNRPNTLATSGDDCAVRFWDLRRPEAPLLSLSEHSHWVWNVRYNRFHDQLVLSAGTDAVVCMWSLPSISSVRFDLLASEEAQPGRSAPAVGVSPQKDGMAKKLDEHEESVYGLDWSAGSPWTFASLSYDGRVAVNRVPTEQQYTILL